MFLLWCWFWNLIFVLLFIEVSLPHLRIIFLRLLFFFKILFFIVIWDPRYNIPAPRVILISIDHILFLLDFIFFCFQSLCINWKLSSKEIGMYEWMIQWIVLWYFCFLDYSDCFDIMHSLFLLFIDVAFFSLFKWNYLALFCILFELFSADV